MCRNACVANASRECGLFLWPWWVDYADPSILQGVVLLGSAMAERGQGAQKLTSCTGFKQEPLGDPKTRGAKQVVLVVQLEKRALYYMYYTLYV